MNIGRVEEIAEKKGWKMSHNAMAGVGKRVTSPIIGLSSVKETVEARRKVLGGEEGKFLKES